MNGITISIDPVIFHVGGFALRWYSLAFAGGIGVAALLTVREAGQKGLDVNKVGNVALWAIVGGLLGARLFHVLDRLDYYLDNPGLILAVNQGGMAIWGGLVTGGLAAVFAARREGIPVLRLADATVIGLLAGQMVGRLGCIVNGDAYGGPTSLPWGFIYVHPDAFVPDALWGVATHPYPLYEILWDGALLGAVLLLRQRLTKEGMLFCVYGAVYGVGRFALTFVREEAVIMWGLQQAQLVAVAAFALALAGLVYLVKSPRRPPEKAGKLRAAAR